MSVLLARQPIVDSKGELFGYELLSRQPDGSGPGQDPGASATATVLWNAMIELGVGSFGQGHALFVNVPDALIDSDALAAAPAECLVVEILEDGLCFRILRCATSAAGGRTRKVSTIREAVVGLKRLRGLASMLVLSGLAGKDVARPTQALVRARFCQELAPSCPARPFWSGCSRASTWSRA